MVFAAVFLAGCANHVTRYSDSITENVALNVNIAAYPDQTEIVTFQLTPSETDDAPDAQDCDSEPEYDIRYNVTPSEITEKYGMTIYKYNKSCASVLFYDGEYYTLGTFFGGFGADSFAIADLNGDDCEELYFTFSWGSGIHRSQIGCFDTAEKQILEYGFSNYFSEMVLTAEDNRLLVYDADLDYENISFVDMNLIPTEKIGELVFDGKEVLLQIDETDESFSPVIFSLTD